MPNAVFLSEYLNGTRTAQVHKETSTGKFYVYCFCCGEEAQSEAFDSEQSAEDWAEDWVDKQVELPELVEKASANGGCGCQD